MENVPNMVAMQNGHFRTKILDAFRKAGYARTAVVPVVASDFLIAHDTHPELS